MNSKRIVIVKIMDQKKSNISQPDVTKHKRSNKIISFNSHSISQSFLLQSTDFLGSIFFVIFKKTDRCRSLCDALVITLAFLTEPCEFESDARSMFWDKKDLTREICGSSVQVHIRKSAAKVISNVMQVWVSQCKFPFLKKIDHNHSRLVSFSKFVNSFESLYFSESRSLFLFSIFRSYSGCHWKVYEYCFMRQNFHFQRVLSQYKNANKPLRFPGFHTTH